MKKTYYRYFPTGVGLFLMSFVLASLAMTTTNVTTDQLALVDLRIKSLQIRIKFWQKVGPLQPQFVTGKESRAALITTE